MTEPSGPPSYVPTLTQVVHAVDETVLPSSASVPAIADSDATQALLVARVLERVEQTLETRLHEALAPLIHAHLQELLPRLQDEIELTVRETVAQAFVHESQPNPQV
ncbi:MAG: hypothetical protein ACWA6Y_04135 [Polaromonas sp.]